MARALVLSNGKFLVTLDRFGFVRDVNFPYVGLENHVSGHKHRIGIQVDEVFSWIDDPEWQITIGYKPETMVGFLVCKNESLQISLVMEDCVYNETDVFMRQVDVYNHSPNTRRVRLFFHQVFLISENRKRNTAFYDPTHNVIVHYRGRRVFLVNGETEDGTPIDDYSIGAYQYEGKEGTFRDAEDGVLGKNAVEHGSVDSVVRMTLQVESKSKSRAFYWFVAGKSLTEVYELNSLVKTKTPEGILHSTEHFWHAWLKEQPGGMANFPAPWKKAFDTSLLILRAHFDNRGSVIASSDSAMIEYGKDDYTYMWPRDAAFVVMALDKAGYVHITNSFFRFCQNVLHPDGYLHHRFNSDQSLGSTWHSTIAQKGWLKDKLLQLPIQEDESAAVLFALWKHYEQSKDLEFIEELYQPLVAKIAQFLLNFRQPTTGLPLPSYDLWEEKMGISTYTCAAVYGGLQAAAKLSELLGKRNHMREYQQGAKEIKQAMIEWLYDQEQGHFGRTAVVVDDKLQLDKTIDASSVFGLWYFEVFSETEGYFNNSLLKTQAALQNQTDVGGVVRYENDVYFSSKGEPNPWLITTAWEALRLLHSPQWADPVWREQARKKIDATIEWVLQHQYPSGVFPEQLDPVTGESLSATPLVWSHAVFVELMLTYLEKTTNPEKDMALDLPTPREI